MSEWSGPTPSPQEYPKGNVESNGLQRVVDDLRAIPRQIRESTSNLLSTAGLFVSRAGLRVASSLSVEGDLDATGNTTLGGNVAITGTLTLNPGAVGNDALTSPVTFRSDRSSEYNFAISTTATNRSPSTVTVPDGYTKALVTVFASCLAKNTTASTQYIYLRARADTSTGAFQFSLRQQVTLSAGFWGTLIVPMIVAFDGLSGGATITSVGVVSATADMTADPNVVVDSEISATFSR